MTKKLLDLVRNREEMLQKNVYTKVTPDWVPILKQFFGFDNFKTFDNIRKSMDETHKDCFPPPELCFRAFKETSLEDLKVVILGQDPYHGPGQANGLAFSYSGTGTRMPPSLVNILQELKDNFPKIPIQNRIDRSLEPDLVDWARQGVLLLNSALTVLHKQPNSHSKIWRIFTESILRRIAQEKPNTIFVLWGNNSQEFIPVLKQENIGDGLILKAAHPSPFSAHKGFFGCNHFKIINHILSQQGRELIDWFSIKEAKKEYPF